MATQVLTDAFVLLNSVNLSDHVKSVELSQSVDMQDGTAMTNDTKISKAGLKDWSLKITFHQDYAAAKVDATVSPLIGTTVPIEVRPTSGARSTTNPGWTGTGVISDYQPVAGGVGDEQMTEVTIQAASTLVRNTA